MLTIYEIAYYVFHASLARGRLMFVPFDEAAPSGAVPIPVDPEVGCAYIAGEPCDPRCGAPRQPGSSYCGPHHGLCHLPKAGARARRQSREADALAAAVGGRRGRPGRLPPDRFVQRLERLLRDFSRPHCSRNVPNEVANGEKEIDAT
jgi:hypothetical protein